MSTSRRIVLGRFALLLVSAGSLSGCRSGPEVAPPAAPLGEFSAARVGGGDQRFEPTSLVKPALFIFWASWCDPCRAEVPELIRLHAERGDRVDLIGVNVDKDPGHAAAFIRAAKIPYPNLSDPDLALSDRFGVRDIPNFVLVGRGGAVRFRGTEIDDDLLEAIERER
jgi:thiol-disulfide isomerase/thioredoxin